MPSSGPLAQWLAGLASNIHHSDPAMVGIAVAVLAGGCAFCSWRTWRNVSHIRLIEDTPTAKIRSAHQGYVELEGAGRLMDGPPIIAKLSGLPCVWFRYKIEHQIKTHYKGHTQTRWEVIEKGESTETFWLEDETGRVVIVHEAPRSFGPGAEIMARLMEKSFLYLEAPIRRVTGFDIVIPLFQRENQYLPGADRIVSAVRETLEF